MADIKSIENNLYLLYSYLRDNGFVSQSQKLLHLFKDINEDFSKFKNEIQNENFWIGTNSVLDIDIRRDSHIKEFKEYMTLFLFSLRKNEIDYPNFLNKYII